MARVLALIPDLLFGSRVQADLRAGGHEVELVSTQAQARERLKDVEVLVVDLTGERPEGLALVRGLRKPDAASNARPATPLRTLGFYSHVDRATREQAQQAGFDLVVPRSRMAREGAALVSRLAGE